MKIISSYPQSRYIAPQHLANRFTFKDGAFIAELSDFNGSRAIAQLYDDACDVGMVIVNPKTDKAVPFFHSRTERNAEGEIVAEHLEVCPEAARRDAAIANLRVVLFND